MALCPRCSRVLPANGNCLYCGKLDVEGAYRKPSRAGGRWMGRLLKLAGAAGICAAACWIAFTEGGRSFAGSLAEKFGLGANENASPWVKPLLKHPKVKELVQSPGTMVVEETLADDASTKLVTIMRVSGSETVQYAWKVNRDTGEIRPLNFEAESLTR